MKGLIAKGIFALLLARCAIPVAAQGEFLFYNTGLYDPTLGTSYRAGIFRRDSFGNRVGAGAGFTAGLFLANDLETPIATTTFRTNSSFEVFATFQQVKVPGVPPGQSANLVVRVWETARGSFEATVLFGGLRGEEWFQSQPLSNPFPVDMYPFRGFEITPGLSAVGYMNWGFELGEVESGTITTTLPFPWAGSFDLTGVINPTGTGHFPSGVPEGKQAAILGRTEAPAGAIGLGRVSELVLHANQRYTLRVGVGNPASGTSTLGFMNFSGFPGYRLDWLAGTNVLASDVDSSSIPEGEFREVILVYVSGETHEAMGKSLKVQMLNLNLPGTAEAPGVAVAFDDVRVFEEPINPELRVNRLAADELEIKWTDASESFTLESADDPGAPIWEHLNDRVSDRMGNHIVQVRAAEERVFYRLRAVE